MKNPSRLASVDTPEIRERWKQIADIIGADMAFFVTCAWVNLPYDPKISATKWESYVSKLRTKADKTFIDGTTDIRDSIKGGMSQLERWEAEWGVGGEGNPYSEKDYRRLDDIFRTLSARNEGMDEQQEYTLRKCAQMALLSEKYIAKGGKDAIDAAKSLEKMIQDNLASENLRKKDMGSAESARIDGITEVTKKKLGFGVEVTYQQAVEACSKWLISHHYNITQDAAEKIMLAFTNMTRANMDLSPIPYLPAEALLDDFKNEFESPLSAAGQREKGVYEYLGVVRGSQRAPYNEDTVREEQRQEAARAKAETMELLGLTKTKKQGGGANGT
jgi:hypothetical protein